MVILQNLGGVRIGAKEEGKREKAMSKGREGYHIYPITIDNKYGKYYILK